MAQGSRSPAWRLDELGHAGPEHLEPAQVVAYDRKAAFDPTPDVELLRSYGLDGGSLVVDLGAGTGSFALAVAPACDTVVAVDVSAPMLDVLRAKAAVLGISNVRVVEAGFLTYEHADRPADVVHSRHALHHLPDFWKAIALRRMARMLRPGGVLRLRDLVFSFPPDEADAMLDRWVRGGADRTETGWTPAERATHLREEHSTFTWLLEPMLQHAGFDVVDVRHGDDGVHAAYVCTRRRDGSSAAASA